MEKLTKYLSLFIFSTYGLGFIIINSFLTRFGIHDKDVFNIDFLKAGFNLLLFLSPSLILLWITKDPDRKGLLKKRWIVSFVAILGSNFFIFLFYFGLYKDKLIILLTFLILSIITLTIIIGLLSKRKVLGHIVFIIFLIIIVVVETYISFKVGIKDFSAFWIILICTLFTWSIHCIWMKYRATRQTDKFNKITLTYSLIFVLILTAAVYGGEVYARIPFIIGGGESTNKQYLPNNNFNESLIDKFDLDSAYWSKKIEVVYENSKRIYFVANDSTIISVNKESIDEIVNYNR